MIWKKSETKKPKRQQKCNDCLYVWETQSEMKKPTCPSCGKKNTVPYLLEEPLKEKTD